MSMEYRYIIFAGAEIRRAVVSSVGRQYNARAEDFLALEILGDTDAPVVAMRLPNKSIQLTEPDLVRMLLLYCRERGIPISQRSQKKVRRSPGGLTLVLASGQTEGGDPAIVDDRIIYRDIAATQELVAAKQELARAIARAEHAERRLAESDERAATADRSRTKAAIEASRPQARVDGGPTDFKRPG